MTSPLLVFDLDGTLVDSAPDLLGDARRGPAAPRVRGAAQSGHARGNRTRRAPHDRGGSRAPGRHARRRADRALSTATSSTHYEANISRRTRGSIPGTEALLDRFAAAAWAFAVCTNKKESLARLLLQELGVAERFAAICGLDTSPCASPIRGTSSEPSRRPAASRSTRSWSAIPAPISTPRGAPTSPSSA